MSVEHEYDLESRLCAMRYFSKPENYARYPGHVVADKSEGIFTANVIDCCVLILLGKHQNALSHYNLEAGHQPGVYIPEMLSRIDENAQMQAYIIGGDQEHVDLIQSELSRERIALLGTFVEDWTPGKGKFKDIALDGQYRKIILAVNRNAFLIASY